VARKRMCLETFFRKKAQNRENGGRIRSLGEPPSIAPRGQSPRKLIRGMIANSVKMEK